MSAAPLQHLEQEHAERPLVQAPQRGRRIVFLCLASACAAAVLVTQQRGHASSAAAAGMPFQLAFLSPLPNGFSPSRSVVEPAPVPPLPPAGFEWGHIEPAVLHVPKPSPIHTLLPVRAPPSMVESEQPDMPNPQPDKPKKKKKLMVAPPPPAGFEWGLDEKPKPNHEKPKPNSDELKKNQKDIMVAAPGMHMGIVREDPVDAIIRSLPREISLPRPVHISARSVVHKWKALAQASVNQGLAPPGTVEVFSSMEDAMNANFANDGDGRSSLVMVALVSSVELSGVKMPSEEEDVLAIGQLVIRFDNSQGLIALSEARGLRQPGNPNPPMVVDISNVVQTPGNGARLIRHIVRWASSSGFLVVVKATSVEMEMSYVDLDFQRVSQWAQNGAAGDDDSGDKQMVYVGEKPANLGEMPEVDLVKLDLPVAEQ